jgi:hypothetical protein
MFISYLCQYQPQRASLAAGQNPAPHWRRNCGTQYLVPHEAHSIGVNRLFGAINSENNG